MLDLFGTAQQDVIDQAGRQPAQRLETTPGQSFQDAWDANTRYGGIMSFQNNLADAAQDSLDAFEARTGEKLPNPYRVPWNPLAIDVGKQMEALAHVRERTQAKATELDDPSLAFPEEDALRRAGIAKARQALATQARGAEGQTAFGTGIAAGAAGFGTQFTDPMNLGLNAIAIATLPEGGGLIRGLVTAGAAFGGQSAIEEATTYGYKREVNPEHGLGEAATTVLSSALGGVALDAGGRAVGALWRAVMRRAPRVADALPVAAQDAGVVAERTADLDANNPFRTGLPGEAAHNEAIVRVESDLLHGREPTLPDAATAEAAARVGDVFTPPTSSPLDVIDRHAATGAHADLYDRAGRLENDIVQTRTALDQALAPADEQPFGALSQRIGDLQDQLGQITGKRRSSPRAQALRDQIANLQAQNEALTAGAVQRAGEQEQLLRLRLNDLQQQRAALGPEIRAAREATADQLGIALDRTQPIDATPSHSGRTFEPLAEKPTTPPPAPAKKRRAGPSKKRQDEDEQAQAAAQVLTEQRPAVPPTAQEIAGARRQAARSGGAPARSFYGTSSVRVRYELAEARDLITSHDADFNLNPDYPAELQPRDRSSVAARNQVNQLASDLEPERLGPSPEANAGAPIVGPDNIVESGNGRTMALRQAYAGTPTKEIIDRANVMSQFRDAEGTFDVAAAGEAIKRRVFDALADGHSVSIITDGKRTAITATSRLGFIDDSGNRWGIGSIVAPTSDVSAARLEITRTGNGAGAYRAFLERQGYDTTGFREPVLIGRRVSPMDADERAAFAHATNGSASLRMSATEQALSDARYIDQGVADLLQSGAIDSRANRDFVRSFVDKLPAGERGGMLTRDGSLSATGVNRVKAVLVARAYGDPGVVARAFDHPEPNIKTIASALVDAAPDWIKMRDAVTRGEIKAGQDITDDVMQAVRSIMRARDERRPVGELMTQGDFFTSDTSHLAARLFFKDGGLERFLSKAEISDNLTTFARDTLAYRGVETDLFGQPPPSTKDLLGSTVGRSERREIAAANALRPAAESDLPKVRMAADGSYEPPEWTDIGAGFSKREYVLDRSVTDGMPEHVQEIREPQGGELRRTLGPDSRETGHEIAGFGDPFDRRNPGSPGAVERRIRDFLRDQRVTPLSRLSDARQGAIADALRPEAIERATADAKVQAAAEADLRRNIEQGRNRVPVMDQEGNVSLGFADKELHDLDGELKAADEIAACATPIVQAAE